MTTFISIHALREEGDGGYFIMARLKKNFYPRPPRGGRRALCLYCGLRKEISIHALREEGDGGHDRQEQAADGISIHALREEGDTQ